MPRISPRILAFAAASLLLAAKPAVLAADAPAKPNILLFFADDWGRQAGSYADPARPSVNDVVKTPNIDRVGREGVRFTNAFYACPSCTPSRGAVVTGSHFWRTGSTAFLNGGEWDNADDPFDSLPRFPDLLGKSGYGTAKAFKTLVFRPTLPGASINGLQKYLRYGMHVSEGRTPEDRERRRNEVIAQTRESIVRVLEACPPDRPFFFIYGPVNTHRPFAAGSGKALWGIDPDSLKGKLPGSLPDVPEVRTDVADYLGEIQALDLMVGIFLEELEKSGRLENTLLVLTGDNGMPGVPAGKTQLYDFGSHAPLFVRWPGHVKPGRTVDDFVNLIDLAPTFLEVAGIKPPGTMDGRSLLPQLLAEKSGTVDPLRDHAVYGRERHYADARPGNLPYPSRAVRTREFLYIRNFKPDRHPWGDPYAITGNEGGPDFETLAAHGTLKSMPFRDMDSSLTKAWIVTHRSEPEGSVFYRRAFAPRPAEELYDLRRDPDQLTNVANRSEYAEALSRLRQQLAKVMRETRDPRLEDAFDRVPYVERTPGPRKTLAD